MATEHLDAVRYSDLYFEHCIPYIITNLRVSSRPWDSSVEHSYLSVFIRQGRWTPGHEAYHQKMCMLLHEQYLEEPSRQGISEQISFSVDSAS